MNETRTEFEKLLVAVINTSFACGAWNEDNMFPYDEDFQRQDEARKVIVSFYETKIASERTRCANIVKAARFGKIDTDFRTLILMIEEGDEIEAPY